MLGIELGELIYLMDSRGVMSRWLGHDSHPRECVWSLNSCVFGNAFEIYV